MLRVSAGLLQGSRSSVVRASTAKVGGLGFDSQWLPKHFFSQFVSMLIYHHLVYQQFLPPVISIVTEDVVYHISIINRVPFIHS